MTRAKDISKILTDADISGNIDVDGVTNLDVVDIDGAVDMASTLAVTGIATFTDDIIIGDGKTIGSASDVDAMTIASNGQVTFTQTLIGTALDISGNIDVDGTTNLDAVDIDGAVQLGASGDDIRMTLTGNNQYRLNLVNGTAASVILGSGGANNFRISNSGGATIFEIDDNKDIILPGSGAGIHLGVTSATASNLLDDYEEGTFTAQISTDTTYVGDAAQSGVYTKIGDMCFFQIRFQRTGTLNSGSNARFGLPFTSANNGVQASGLRGSVENIDTSVVGVGGTIAANSAILYLNEMTAAVTGHNLNGSDLGANFQVQIQGFYKTA